MADDADVSDVKSQLILDATIANIRARSVVVDNASGVCVICGADVEPVLAHGRVVVGRWCSVECRDVWSRENE